MGAHQDFASEKEAGFLFFENEVFTKAATGRIPLGRILEADEIAGAIVFLASPLARAVTGVTLPVDGGWTAGEPALPW